MKIPRPDEDAKEFFKSIIPKDPQVTLRPMFGNLSGFVKGNMFMGLLGKDVFLRLSDQDREELLQVKGASIFEPMKGRPMKEYVVIPSSWREQPALIHTWVSRSLAWARKLPEKKQKGK
jgi:TfoX/Sxy family transcriptional regulator of competence genes